MSRLDEMMKDMTVNTEPASEVETVGGTDEMNEMNHSETNESIAVESNESSDVEKTDETPKSNEDTVSNTEVTKDNNKSKYTPEQKAEYAFKKRLDRERRKYDSQILELKKQLEALQNPTKKREDYANDEEYVKDFFGNMINDAFNKRDEEYRKKEEMMNAQAQVMESFANQVERDFGNLEEYNSVVENSLEAGLGELIENNPTVKQFIQQSDNSAKVLYMLATNQDAVNKVFRCKTEWDMFYNLKRLEESLESQSFIKSQVNNVNPAVKPIGKVGGQGGQTNENWDDRAWIMKQIRGR